MPDRLNGKSLSDVDQTGKINPDWSKKNFVTFWMVCGDRIDANGLRWELSPDLE